MLANITPALALASANNSSQFLKKALILNKYEISTSSKAYKENLKKKPQSGRQRQIQIQIDYQKEGHKPNELEIRGSLVNKY